MKKIKKIMLPLLSATALSSCIVPLVACNPKVATYTVTVREHGVSVIAKSTATQNEDYSFERYLGENEEIDYNKSYITVGDVEIKEGEYTVEGNKVTIPASKVTGNIVINLWAESTKMAVSYTHDGHVSIDGEKFVVRNAAYTFTTTFEKDYAIDEANWDVLMGGKSIKSQCEFKDNKGSIPANVITSDITISIVSMKVKHGVDVVKGTHVANVDVASSAEYGKELKAVVTFDNNYVPDLAKSQWFIGTESHTFDEGQVTGSGNTYTFTVAGSEIKDSVKLSFVAAWNTTKIEIKGAEEDYTDVNVDTFTKDQVANIHFSMVANKKLADTCTIYLDDTERHDFVIADNYIQLSKTFVNAITDNSKIVINLATVATMNFIYKDNSGHFQTDERIHSTFTPGEKIIFDLSNVGEADTGWYGLEYGYKITTAGVTLTAGIFEYDETAPGKYVIKDHNLTKDQDFTFDASTNKVVVDSSITSLANLKNIKITFTTEELPAYVGTWTPYDRTEYTGSTAGYSLTTNKTQDALTGTNNILHMELKQDATGATADPIVGGRDVTLKLKLTDTKRPKQDPIYIDEATASAGVFTWTNNACEVNITAGQAQPKPTGGAVYNVECEVFSKIDLAYTIGGDAPTGTLTMKKPEAKDVLYKKPFSFTYSLTDPDHYIFPATANVSVTDHAGYPHTLTPTIDQTNKTIEIDGNNSFFGCTYNVSFDLNCAWCVDPNVTTAGKKYWAGEAAGSEHKLEYFEVSKWHHGDSYYTDPEYLQGTDEYVIDDVEIRSQYGTPSLAKLEFVWGTGTADRVTITGATWDKDTKKITIPASAFSQLVVGTTRHHNFYISTEWSVA